MASIHLARPLALIVKKGANLHSEAQSVTELYINVCACVYVCVCVCVCVCICTSRSTRRSSPCVFVRGRAQTCLLVRHRLLKTSHNALDRLPRGIAIRSVFFVQDVELPTLPIGNTRLAAPTRALERIAASRGGSNGRSLVVRVALAHARHRPRRPTIQSCALVAPE